MREQLFGLVKTSFVLVALYLVLTRAAGSASILRAAGTTWVNLIRALQGRG